MAKNLKNYKRREVRCLIVEDFETGKVFKAVKEDEINECLSKYTEDEITKVYNPSTEQKDKIYKLMDIKGESGKVITKIEGIDLLINVIPMLTDIKIDLSKDEDIELINEIIQDPNDVFNEVAKELNAITMKLSLDWIDNLKLLNELPDDIINALANKGEENGDI